MTIDTYREIVACLRNLIEGTRWEGNVYCVGGCCRDEILGTDIHDIDLAVSLPDGGIRFAEWLERKHLLLQKPVEYPKFGTAMVILKQFPDHDLELVQTRSEQYNDRNSRNPETAFGTVEEDCLRRDFTINSLYYDISRDEYIDLTRRGRKDIEDHVIRTPVDPDMTFDDDPVRILRCVRFAARFDWEIEPQTYEALKRNIARLSIVSPNRMRNEIERMLLGPRPVKALKMLREIGAIHYIMPELEPLFHLRQPGHPYWTVWDHTLKVVEMVEPVAELRFAALLHDVGKAVTVKKEPQYDQHETSGANLIRKFLYRLHCHTEFTKTVIYLVINHTAFRTCGDQGQFVQDKRLRKLQYLSHSRRRFSMLLQLVHVDNVAQHPPYCLPAQIPAVERHIEKMDREGTSMYHYHLPVSSEEIRSVKGPLTERQLRRTEDYLLRLVFENPSRSVENLLKHLREYNTGSLASAQSLNKRRRSKTRHKRKVKNPPAANE